jgi:hypothetical protein
VSSVCVYGLNQNGQPSANCWNTPAPQYNFDNLSGWWWKGVVEIDPYNPGYLGYITYCTIPTVYPDDYFVCST